MKITDEQKRMKRFMKGVNDKQHKRLYPVHFNGKLYYKKDVDDLFAACYHDKAALRWDNSVYAGDGISICPDGTISN